MQSQKTHLDPCPLGILQGASLDVTSHLSCSSEVKGHFNSWVNCLISWILSSLVSKTCVKQSLNYPQCCWKGELNNICEYCLQTASHKALCGCVITRIQEEQSTVAVAQVWPQSFVSHWVIHFIWPIFIPAWIALAFTISMVCCSHYHWKI